MKEVKEWDNNPREMWVWDYDSGKKKKAIVVFIKPNFDSHSYSVVAWHKEHDCVSNYMHCAEIEDEKERLMTNRELARWLREKPDRECKYHDYEDGDKVYQVHEYYLDIENEEVGENVRVRIDGGEWERPVKSLLGSDYEN